MEPADLYTQHNKVFILDTNTLIEVDYDSLEIGSTYVVITKTKSYSIYKKTETFDDDFIKLEKNKSQAEDFLRTEV